MNADKVTPTGPVRVLIIEDDDDIRSMMRRMLRKAGYEVIEARDGDGGLASCASCRIDVVITDIVMPGKEGMETIREIRGAYPDISIVAVSGGGDTSFNISYLAMAEMLGAARTLAKPFRSRDLLRIVEELAPPAA